MHYLIFPDLHGQYYSFIKLLKQYIIIKNGRIINNEYKIIILGDIIDKGNIQEQIKLLNFIHVNKDKLILIKGNHEVKTYNKIFNSNIRLSNHYDFYLKIIRGYKSNDFKNKFIDIYNNMLLYYEDENIFCNHSPCLEKHIKEKDGSLIQYKFDDRKNRTVIEYKEYLLSFFKDICYFNDFHKLHIFGHIGLSKPIINNNQIWLDTNNLNEINLLVIKDGKLTFLNNFDEVNNVFILNETETLDVIIEELLPLAR